MLLGHTSLVHNSHYLARKYSITVTPLASYPNVAPTKFRSFCPSLGKGSSAATDSVAPEMLKFYHCERVPVATNLFNSSLLKFYFPIAWRKVKLTPIPKPSTNSSAPVKYRNNINFGHSFRTLVRKCTPCRSRRMEWSSTAFLL